MAAETLKELLVEELRDILHAEKQLTKALPKMAKAADSAELRKALENHLRETQGHVERVTEVLEELGETVRPKPCDGMKGIIEEGSEPLKELDDGPLLDAAIIAGAQKSEHYEIASYGTVIAWARQLGLDSIVGTLEETLNEEKAADEKLTEIAETLNQEAELAPVARK